MIAVLAGSGTLANVGKDNPLATAKASSLSSTCRRHGIDPHRYLTQLLTNLPVTPISRMERRSLDQWKLSKPSRSE